MFLDRVTDTVNKYIADAKTHNITLFRRTFNLLHKGTGINRAQAYLVHVTRYYQDEENERALVAKVYEDVTDETSAGMLGSSTEFRLVLRGALFCHFGVNAEQIHDIKLAARVNSFHSVAGAMYGSGAIVEQAIEEAMKNALKELMHKNGYELQKQDKNEVEMLVRSNNTGSRA